jgi:transcription termination factor Rho
MQDESITQIIKKENQSESVEAVAESSEPKKPTPKRTYEIQKKLKSLSAVTHDSNESIRRRKRRTQINKLNNKIMKKKRKPDLDQNNESERSHGGAENVRETAGGVLHIVDGHQAFLRSEKTSFSPSDKDIFIPRELIERWGLRTGLKIHAAVKSKKNKAHRVASEILNIEDAPPRDWRKIAYFQSLTSINPHQFFKLSRGKDKDKSMNLLELLTPIGKGQRALIVAPPRTGKTILLEKIVNGITTNHPDAEAMLLLVDERPEEVTHLSRRVNAKVYASCLDKPIHEHVSLSRMVIEIAHRKVERGKDVVILLDSITRMARAFNNQLKSTGRTLSGGVDAQALHEPKKFFGSARKLEEGGSLTIIATALIQTGSQMDEVIFQEFKGTGNMELVLSRKIAEKRIYPAIDVNMSGTRREELILPERYFQAAIKFRRYLGTLGDSNQIQAAIQAIEKYATTDEFVRAFV